MMSRVLCNLIMLGSFVCLAMPDDVSYLQIKSNASVSIQTGAFPLGKNLCANKDKTCCGKAAGELRGAIIGLGEQAVFAALIAFGFPKKNCHPCEKRSCRWRKRSQRI